MRGIPPAQILAASPAELAFLDAARALAIKEQFTVTRNAVMAALSKDADKEAERIYG